MVQACDFDHETCDLLETLESTDQQLILAELIYTSKDEPNFQQVNEYNAQLSYNTAPDNTALTNGWVIKNAWLEILYVTPAVWVEDVLIVPEEFETVTGYDYKIELPTDTEGCGRKYSLVSKNIDITTDDTIKAIMTISAKVRIDYYRLMGKRGRQRCEFHYSKVIEDTLTVTDMIDVLLEEEFEDPTLSILQTYHDTMQGEFDRGTSPHVKVQFDDSSIDVDKYAYTVRLDHAPYNYATIEAIPSEEIKLNNVKYTNDTFYTNESESCAITTKTFFTENEEPCSLEEIGAVSQSFPKKDRNINILPILIIFSALILAKTGISIVRKAIQYKSLAKGFSKLFVIFLLIVSMPMVSAEPTEEPEISCSITNLSGCLYYIPYAVSSMLNTSLEPVVGYIKEILQADIGYEIYQSTWQTIVSILAGMYVIFLAIIGYMFIFTGSNPAKRMQAKKVLVDWFVMLVLVSGSFYIYGLLIDLSVNITSVFLSRLDPNFFLVHADNLGEIVASSLFLMFYTMILWLTLLFLTLRYIVVMCGIIFFPIGLCFSFVPYLRTYGKVILHTLLVFIFLPVFHAIIFLATSAIVSTNTLSYFFSPLFILVSFVIVIWSTIASFKLAFKIATLPTLPNIQVPRPVMMQTNNIQTTKYNIEAVKKE